MRAIVVGLGVQGHKRRTHAGADYVCCVDPVSDKADHKNVEDVPLGSYDAALVCTPDEPKIRLLEYFLSHGKHVLVEKPLFAESEESIRRLESLARSSKAVCYTAYNHRFEPHFVRMRDLIASGELGKIYRCRMFYGNGTSQLVKASPWRDQGGGVIPDLGSHLLDTTRFWFGDIADTFELVSADRHECRAPDHAVVASTTATPRIEFEMTMLSWRNHFTCDVFAEKGSAHIRSLCKWGPSTFTKRTRVLPSGRPPEESVTLVQDDPTWAAEYGHFKRLVSAGVRADLGGDVWLNSALRKLSMASACIESQ